MLAKLKTILKHLWLDVDDSEHAVPPDVLHQLAKRVAASEARHTGQIRIILKRRCR